MLLKDKTAIVYGAGGSIGGAVAKGRRQVVERICPALSNAKVAVRLVQDCTTKEGTHD